MTARERRAARDGRTLLVMRSSIALLVLVSLVACGSDAAPGAARSTSTAAGGDALNLPTGCSVAGAASAAKGFLAKQKLVVSGVKDPGYANRTYGLYVPDGHDGDHLYPLVFEFHGNGGDGTGMRKTLDLETASKGGAIVVYPDGFGGWDLESPADQNDDIKLVKALVAEIGKTYCVDTARVFATGYSNGGYFANQLGCRVGAPFFRGIAAHSGGGPFGADNEYDDQGNLVCPGKPVAALVSHGAADTNVKLSEGQMSRDEWKRFNGCKDATTPFDPSPCVRFEGCAEGRPVVYCEIPGLGHVVWPEGGAAATWRFLSGL